MIEARSVGRNEPCPCSSGKRYKDCHGSLRGSEKAVIAGSRVESETIDLREAAHLFDAGDVDGAETVARKALAINSRDAEALRLLGHCEHAHGRAWEALRLALDAARATFEVPMPSATQFAIWTDLNAMLTQALQGVDSAVAAAKRAEFARWSEARAEMRRDATPQVSIIVIGDAEESDLHRTVTSIQSQGYRGLEVVLVTTGPITGPIRDILASVPFASTVVSHPPAHEAVLLNAGLRASQGEYVNPLIAGDEFGADRIDLMVEQIARRNCAWGFSDVEFIQPADAPWDKKTATRVERWRDILTGIPNLETAGFALIQPDCAVVTAGNLFFSRALAEQLDGFRAFDHTHVWDFCLRAVWLEEPSYIASRLLRHVVTPASTPRKVEFEAAQVPVFREYYQRACDEHAVAPNPYAPCLRHWRCHFLKAPFKSGHLLMFSLDRIEQIAAQLVRRHEEQHSHLLERGIDFVGFAFAEFGLGENMRAFAHACADADIPFTVKDIDQRLNTRQTDLSVKPYLADELRHRCALFCVNPDLMYLAHPLLVASSSAGGYKIGYWYWELDRLPAVWIDALADLDEIWVASEFVAATIRAETTRPVIKIAPPIAVAPSRDYERSDFSLPQNRFLFLFSFDFNSYPKRKNPEGALTAFKRAFAGRSDVGLVLKSINGKQHPEHLAEIEELAATDERIVMLDGFFSRDGISGLQSVTDCYISLHRSEGLGLGLAESMYQGKPVIATRYSGNLEFMNDDNSCLVDYQLVPVGKGEYLYDDEGFHWAEPDIDQAAHYMRQLVDDRALRERIARLGQDSIRSRFNRNVAAALIRQRLEELEVL